MTASANVLSIDRGSPGHSKRMLTSLDWCCFPERRLVCGESPHDIVELVVVVSEAGESRQTGRGGRGKISVPFFLSRCYPLKLIWFSCLGITIWTKLRSRQFVPCADDDNNTSFLPPPLTASSAWNRLRILTSPRRSGIASQCLCYIVPFFEQAPSPIIYRQPTHVSSTRRRRRVFHFVL